MSPVDVRPTAGPSCVVHYSIRDTVAVLTIDNPPVNASSAAVRAGLLERISEAALDKAVRAVVIIGSGEHFVAGSDLREFSAERLPKPELPEVIAAIEACPKPVVAALSGATLGGGLELALGCDWRIALEGCRVGLPEVLLGIIPGAGGTQRAMRLLGPARALALAASGKTYRISNLAELVDRVVTDDLLDEAIRFAGSIWGKRILMDQEIPPWQAGELADEAGRIIAAAEGRPQIIAAVGAVAAGLILPPVAALHHERSEFTRLRNSPEAAALRYQFFARRAALKANRPSDPSISVQRVSIVGAGRMGLGITRALIEAGVRVDVFDDNRTASLQGFKWLKRQYRRLVGAGQLSRREADERLGRFQVADSLEDLRGADLYIETLFDDLEAKRVLLARLEPLAGNKPLVTTTANLDVEALSAVLVDPGRLVGVHFFTPAHRTRVLEVIRTVHTNAAALNTVFAAARLMDKVPVVAGVRPGLIGNRIYNAFRRQCDLMLQDGASPAEMDGALTAFGFASGPFAASDRAGLYPARRMRQCKAAVIGHQDGIPDAAEGQHGEDRWAAVNTRHSGAGRSTIPPGEIILRALLAMANETALLLADGIAERASDVDLLLVLGLGFPANRGGICFWTGQQDRVTLQKGLVQLSGNGFILADLSRLHL